MDMIDDSTTASATAAWAASHPDLLVAEEGLTLLIVTTWQLLQRMRLARVSIR